MKGLTLTMKEQTRLSIMNGVLERQWSVVEAAQLLGVSERYTWRLLAAYRMEGAAALAYGNRGRLPVNVTAATVQAQVITLARQRVFGVVLFIGIWSFMPISTVLYHLLLNSLSAKCRQEIMHSFYL
ncbi:helix-turn-helix domain-containing protein [Chloroflexota bacterium]